MENEVIEKSRKTPPSKINGQRRPTRKLSNADNSKLPINCQPVKGIVLCHPGDKESKYVVLDIPEIGVRVVHIGFDLEPMLREYLSKNYEKVIEQYKEELIAEYDYSSQSSDGLTFEEANKITEAHEKRMDEIERRYA